ncbi:Uncharacterized protein OS=Amycolatopsis azurea DSM 43854 GN=C791_3997 PE=4 SV=1: DUF4185 [Gemmata massiliana]|uniref:DUF4185 domain-containing protein n=1 Tax=Gemmata massiliana TaxID=1210884 RepID=A0A6P2DKV6_9BACT|nr:DUF4185 domain-containing protein [Gemmata massiliana]VTS01146.1 Uncharacterized protein OS=Amycolatopsis azurea DSM 43854 GN=C791_3997 PE=4 SV=1: DUF4185 [Gemmata massiliana]
MNATALVLLTCLAAPPEPPTVVKAEPDAALNSRFRLKDGWVGGDGAFSVVLSDKRALWLFSDTWIGTVRDGKRKDVTMVNNTVGVQDGAGVEAKFDFAIQKGTNGKPAAIFTPPDGKGWFWQFAGHFADDKLHVFLPRFEKTNDPGAFGFKALDLWLGTVEKPDADPLKWKPKYAKVPFAAFDGGRKFSFGSSVLTVGEHAYVYGYEEKPGKPFPTRKLLTARVPVNTLADFDTWRFLANDAWKADAKDATGQAGGLGTEFSVSYLPGLKQYVLVTTDNGLSDRIVGHFAPAPEGPWSAPVLLYTCPEMKKDKKVFSYAAKAHAHLATGNELVISYVVNSFDLAPVINNADLYWPTFVRVQLK